MVSAQRFIICQHLVLSQTKSLREKTREKRETINSLADALYNQARFLKLKGSETDRSALGAKQQVELAYRFGTAAGPTAAYLRQAPKRT